MLIGGTLNAELRRTADLLINEIGQGEWPMNIFFIVAFLYDASYDTDRIQKLLPILREKCQRIEDEKDKTQNAT